MDDSRRISGTSVGQWLIELLGHFQIYLSVCVHVYNVMLDASFLNSEALKCLGDHIPNNNFISPVHHAWSSFHWFSQWSTGQGDLC